MTSRHCPAMPCHALAPCGQRVRLRCTGVAAVMMMVVVVMVVLGGVPPHETGKTCARWKHIPPTHVCPLALRLPPRPGNREQVPPRARPLRPHAVRANETTAAPPSMLAPAAPSPPLQAVAQPDHRPDRWAAEEPGGRPQPAAGLFSAKTAVGDSAWRSPPTPGSELPADVEARGQPRAAPAHLRFAGWAGRPLGCRLGTGL